MKRKKKQKTILVIDGNLLARKSFYKFRNLSTKICLKDLEKISKKTSKVKQKNQKTKEDFEREFVNDNTGKKQSIKETGKIEDKLNKLMMMNETTQIHTGVMYGMLRSIIAANNKYIDGKTVICYDPVFDPSDPVLPVRKEYFSEYKDRKKDPETEVIFNESLSIAQSFFYQLGIEQIRTEGFEADDLLHYCTHNRFKDDKCIVLTNDHDMFQLLVPNRVALLRLGDTPPLYSATRFENEYGIKPYQWKQVQALGGCSTDNVKGVRGISSDTAVKLIEQYGSITNLIKSPKDDLPKRIVTALAKEKAQDYKNLKMSRKLTKLYGLDEGLIESITTTKATKPAKILLETALFFLKTVKFKSFMSEEAKADLSQLVAKNV